MINVRYMAVGRTIDHVITSEIDLAKDNESATYSENVRLVIQAKQANKPHTKYSLTMKDSTNLNFYTDGEHHIFIVITSRDYPGRVAQQLLKELRNQYIEKFHDQIKQAGQGKLNAKTMFQKLQKKYNDPSRVDKLSKLNSEITQTADIMKDSIKMTLDNIEKAEILADDADTMQRNAKLFGKKSASLKQQMQWQNMKQTAILAAVIVTICVILGLFIYLSFRQ